MNIVQANIELLDAIYIEMVQVHLGQFEKDVIWINKL